mmetsp:Transcript_101641/g.263360  ORF Transcript_101641/g.263360 Transcript_101641/m.263360 type:complete len:224 (+) Transcript_101641:63-734(+)
MTGISTVVASDVPDASAQKADERVFRVRVGKLYPKDRKRVMKRFRLAALAEAADEGDGAGSSPLEASRSAPCPSSVPLPLGQQLNPQQPPKQHSVTPQLFRKPGIPACNAHLDHSARWPPRAPREPLKNPRKAAWSRPKTQEKGVNTRSSNTASICELLERPAFTQDSYQEWFQENGTATHPPCERSPYGVWQSMLRIEGGLQPAVVDISGLSSLALPPRLTL